MFSNSTVSLKALGLVYITAFLPTVFWITGKQLLGNGPGCHKDRTPPAVGLCLALDWHRELVNLSLEAESRARVCCLFKY